MKNGIQKSVRDIDESLWRQAGAQAKLTGKKLGHWLNEAIKAKIKKEQRK